MANLIYQKFKDTHALPSPAGVALEVLRLTSDERATVEEVGKAVESDPAIAGRILKLVNSPFAGVGRKVASVSEAVTLLGLRTIRNLALGLSLVSGSRQGGCKAFDYEAFWSESLARAVAARKLAATLKQSPSEEAFVIGLLAQVGRLALATVRPEEYASVLIAGVGKGDGVLLRLERESFGIDHHTLSAEMMADWYLEPYLCEVVARQEFADKESVPESSFSRQSSLLILAGSTANVLTRDESSLEDLSRLASRAAGMGIAEDAFDTLFEAIKTEWREAGAIFSVRTSEVPSLQTMREGARDDINLSRRAARSSSATVLEHMPSSEGLRILVVDDDPSMLRLLERYLSAAGHTVITATNGVEALDADRRESPQMIITDWMMPEMQGPELCQKLRACEENGFVYILLLTGHSERAKALKALDAGADSLLIKPFSREELLLHVRAGQRIIRLEARLADRDRSVASANARLADVNHQLKLLASTDVLTGLINRREGLARLAEHWWVADRHGEPLSCMIADIDHFKQYNDTCGHAAGDAMLKATACILQEVARAGESVCRLGGEEFLIICPRSTVTSAAVGAERMRMAVEASTCKLHADEPCITVSLGIAERTSVMAGPEDLLKAADEMLYAAKARGRNCTCAAGMDPSSRPLSPAVTLQSSGTKTAFHSPIAEHQGNPPRILVVDDDVLSRTLCRRILEREDCTVFEAVDGLDALEKTQGCSPNVIVLDVMMPRMDGLECARRLKSNASTRDIPIIMLSAADDAAAIEAGLTAGADEYVTKPLNRLEFALRVRSMVRLHSGKTELLWSNEARWEQARAMHVLLDLSCGLVGEKHLDRVLDRILSAASDLTRSQRVSIMLPDTERKYLTLARALGIDAETAAQIRVPVGQAIAGTVYLSGEQIVVNSPEDVRTKHNLHDSPFFVSIPLISKALRTTDHVVGVLNVTDRADHQPFHAGELESLDLLCNIAATAINDLMNREARDRAQQGIVVALATLAECRDVDTGTHLDRMTRYALILAEELRNQPSHRDLIDDELLDALRLAMPLHDIGKVGVPDSILLKPGRLDEAEMDCMRRHVEIGVRILRSVQERTPDAGFLGIAEQVALGHHERWDGLGYPQGKAAQDIPLPARIAAVADVYDALTTKRIYKEAIPHEQAVRIIQSGSGTQFDPQIVEAFRCREEQFERIATELADISSSEHTAEVLVTS